MENKYLGIYHSADADGWACAAIYKHKFGEDIEIIGYNYGQPIDHILEKAKGKIVFIADVTFTYLDTITLSNVAKEVIICDHHETAWKDFNEKSAKEIHLNIHYYYNRDIAGCEVLWNKLFAGRVLPAVIQAIGIYDTAREGVFEDNPTDLGKAVIDFTYGFREVPYAERIDKIVDIINDFLLFGEMMSNGGIIKRYSDAQNERVEHLGTQIVTWVFEVEGEVKARKYKIAATNATIDPSQFRPKGEYEFICNYYKAKDGSYKYSLRPGNNQGKNPHLGEIAAQFEHNGTKGGGHADAAGFTYHKNIFE